MSDFVQLKEPSAIRCRSSRSPVAVVLVNVAVAVAVVTTAKKALTRIGKNWVKEGENEQETVDAVQIGVCISVCVCSAENNNTATTTERKTCRERVPSEATAAIEDSGD